MESDEIIKSSVEILIPIPSEFEGISEDTCDVPVCENPSTFDALNDHSEILSDSNDDGTSSDDNDFEDIEYVSLEEVNDVDQKEKEFDLEDILQIQDSPCFISIPIMDSDSFFDKANLLVLYSDNSLPEFEPFKRLIRKRQKWHVPLLMINNSSSRDDSFLFEIEPIRMRLPNVFIEEVDTLHCSGMTRCHG
ncbi:hypothetical protein Tco_0548992 [Tanacetum coccineum]